MNNIVVNDPLGIKNIIQNIPSNKLIFWIGAGIDNGIPTSLPLGNELTNHILELTCGKYKETLIEIWNRNCNLISSISNQKIFLPERPRLETIIEIVREFEDNQLKKMSVIEGLKSFSSLEFNPNHEHYVLANYLHKGANIVTTNYGDFICKAYEEQYGAKTIQHEYNQMHIYQVNNAWASRIYHIHGISDDLNTIGANLSNVKKSLPNNFKSVFKYWLENEYYIIFMGYSGLDSLDVNPFFKSLSNNNNATGIYVRHSSDKNNMCPTDREEILLHPFGHKFVCPCVTSNFFVYLKDYQDRKVYVRTTPLTKWKNNFDKYTKKYTSEYSSTLMLGMCYRLGIPITLIFNRKDWFATVSKCKNIVQWYRRYYSFENAVMVGNRRVIRKAGRSLLKNDRLMKLNYKVAMKNNLYTVKDIISIIESPIKILHRIENLRDNNQMVKWDISTDLNRYVEVLLFKILRFPFGIRGILKKINEEYDILNVIKCCEFIINGGYDFVVDVNQINTAYRTLALCQIMTYQSVNVSNNNINKALENYIEVSSLAGIVMTMVYKSLIWMIDYSIRYDYNSLLIARQNFKTSYKIVFECQLLKYVKYCYAIRGLYWYLKFISLFKR